MLDTKKIPQHIGWYLSGFADGEGSFMVVFRPRKDYRTSWKISLCFNVSNKDKVILSLFKRYLKCGTLRKRKDGVYYYEVNNIKSLKENVIPFFEKFKFLSSKKKKDFSVFKKILQIILENKHQTKEGIARILSLRKELNRDTTKESITMKKSGEI